MAARQSQSQQLFSPSLLPDTIISSLPQGYNLRSLISADHSSGFLDVLKDLTRVGDITAAEFEERYNWLATEGKGTYYVVVIEDDKKKVVATGQLVVERKFIHHCGLVGHLEDIAVSASQQGKSLGKKIIATLDHIAEQVGCYKVILDCGDSNTGFYEKCGYSKKEWQMARYFEGKKAQYMEKSSGE